MGKHKKLDELSKFIEEYVGDAGRAVFEVLIKRNKELTDSEIVSETGINEQEVRRALYELHSLGIVAYKKKQSPEDGRFTYTWFIDGGRLNQVLLQRKKEVLSKLKARLNFESSNTFYVCDVDGVRLTFDEAFENDFKCPKCGADLTPEDNSLTKEFLKKMIAKLEEEISNEEKELTS
ncbi:MAG: transcription factor [Desulfurococcaceae archaeon TW002]